MYFDNLEYARMRLVGTLVRLDDEPFTVAQIKPLDKPGDFKVQGYLLKNGDVKTTMLSKLNLEPVSLGYVNYEGNAFYLVRKPMRGDYRQGLRRDNMAFIGDQGFIEFPRELCQTIRGEYPPFIQAVKNIQLGYKSCAFSRDFAVNSNKNVVYKQRVVGTYDKLITLYEKFKYLNNYVGEILDA